MGCGLQKHFNTMTNSKKLLVCFIVHFVIAQITGADSSMGKKKIVFVKPDASNKSVSNIVRTFGQPSQSGNYNYYGTILINEVNKGS